MIEVIVLAAGQGTRMHSVLPKVLHPLAGKPLIHHVVDCARHSGADKIHLVVGHGADEVEAAVTTDDCVFHRQNEQLGTGHAVLQALPACQPSSTVIVLFGDVPLLTHSTLTAVIQAAEAGPVMLSAVVDDPEGYGRVVRGLDGEFLRVVEHKDANPEELAIAEINTGVLAAKAEQLSVWLDSLDNNNSQGEYYLPDVLAKAIDSGVDVAVVKGVNDEWLGVNDRAQLAQVERLFQARQAKALMANGLGIADPSRVDIRGELSVGRDVFLDVGVVIEGDVHLADNVLVEPYAVLKNCSVAAGTVVRSFSHIEDSQIGEHCQIGPYARIRPGSQLDDSVKIGNFVEVKNSQLGTGAKANHLAYVGDADVGADSNIGAGTITCNYDGANKHKTQLGDRVFIGSNSTLVAPLIIADDGFVAAGSTVTLDVERKELAVGRAKQRNIAGWKRPTKSTKG